MTLPLLYKGLTSFVQSRSIAQRQQSRNDILRNTTTPPSADPEIAGSAERAELPALLLYKTTKVEKVCAILSTFFLKFVKYAVKNRNYSFIMLRSSYTAKRRPVSGAPEVMYSIDLRQ